MFGNLKIGTRLAIAYAVSEKETARASERRLLFVKLDSQKLAT
ncbi:hypothetical protein ACFQAT_11815 [Undibacterium arcticum]